MSHWTLYVCDCSWLLLSSQAYPIYRGAKVAMTVALRRPSLVGALIPVDNGPADAVLKGNFPKYTFGMKKVLEANVTKAGEADRMLQEYAPELPVRQFLLTNLVRPSPGHPHCSFRIPLNILSSALGSMGDFPFKDPDVVRYDGPTLVVRGTKSDYVPDEMLPLIGRFFPRFECVDVEAGHWITSEKPEEFRRGE
jgi:pimeloyl-ACP methyl ester carboxylesterase